MHPLEWLFAFLIASDIIWGVGVAIYLLIAMPIAYFVIRKRERK